MDTNDIDEIENIAPEMNTNDIIDDIENIAPEMDTNGTDKIKNIALEMDTTNPKNTEPNRFVIPPNDAVHDFILRQENSNMTQKTS